MTDVEPGPEEEAAAEGEGTPGQDVGERQPLYAQPETGAEAAEESAEAGDEAE